MVKHMYMLTFYTISLRKQCAYQLAGGTWHLLCYGRIIIRQISCLYVITKGRAIP